MTVETTVGATVTVSAPRLSSTRHMTCLAALTRARRCARSDGHVGHHRSRGAMDAYNRSLRQPRCDAVMPQYGDRCARLAGHQTEHRSRYALDNALEAWWGRHAQSNG